MYQGEKEKERERERENNNALVAMVNGEMYFYESHFCF